MTIATIISVKGDEVASISSNAPLSDAVSELSERKIGSLLVIDDGQVAGIISERDVIRGLEEHGGALLDMPVSEVMSSPAITVAPDSDVLAALALMTRRRIRHLPVIEGGELKGIVSIGDLVKFRIESIEAEAQAMLQYIQAT